MHHARPDAVIITLPAACSFPNACANCGGPNERPVPVSLKVNRSTKTYSIPSCHACARRQNGHSNKSVLLWLMGALATVGASIGAEFALRAHAGLAWGISLGGGFVIALGVYLLLLPKKVALPATSGTAAVRLTAWNPNYSWFLCTNADWGAHAAQLSGGQIMPTVPRPYRAWGHFFSLIAASVMTALFAFIGARPTVCFRNPTADPLAFYVDNELLFIVLPQTHRTEDITYGKHTVGWSSATAGKPTGAAEVDLEIANSHLINPNAGGCFWLDGAGYGTGKVDEKKLGPLPLQTFYVFDHVDLWFQALPKSITTKNSGETRIAVQTYPLCESALKTCERELVKKALACDSAAKTLEDSEKCWVECGLVPEEKGKESDTMSDVAKDVAFALSVAAATPVEAGVPDAGADAGAKKKKKPKPKP